MEIYSWLERNQEKSSYLKSRISLYLRPTLKTRVRLMVLISRVIWENSFHVQMNQVSNTLEYLNLNHFSQSRMHIMTILSVLYMSLIILFWVVVRIRLWSYGILEITPIHYQVPAFNTQLRILWLIERMYML